MTTHPIRTRSLGVLGTQSDAMAEGRALHHRRASDDSGAFCLTDARQPRSPRAVLVGTSNHSVARQRLTTEATRPCFYCRGGLERCEACQGRGCTEGRDTCDHCLGTGYRNCDFCGGSGLIGTDAVPANRRVAIAIERIREPARQLHAVMAQPVPRPSRDQPPQSLQESGRALLEVNRFVAMLEDGLYLLHADPRNALGDNDALSRVIRFCLKLAIESQQRMREIIKGMAATAWRLAEQSEPGSDSRLLAINQATFYASLLRQSGLLTGTGLERPLLSTAIERLSGGSVPLTPGRERPREKP